MRTVNVKSEREREELKNFLEPFRECVQTLPEAIGVPKNCHDPALPITIFIHLLLNEFGRPEENPKFWEQLQFAISLKHTISSYVDSNLTREYNQKRQHDRHSNRTSFSKNRCFEFSKNFLCLTHAYSAITWLNSGEKTPASLPGGIDTAAISANKTKSASKVTNLLRSMGSLPTDKTDGIKFLLVQGSPNKCLASLIRLWKTFCHWVTNVINRLTGQMPVMRVPRNQRERHQPKPCFFIPPPQKPEPTSPVTSEAKA